MTALAPTQQHERQLAQPLEGLTRLDRAPCGPKTTLVQADRNISDQEAESCINHDAPSTSTPPQDYICGFESCGRLFTKLSKFEDHKRSHTGERPFQCGVPGCDKSFIRKDHLQRHAKAHAAPTSSTSRGDAEEILRPHRCTILADDGAPCLRRFLTKQHLDRHVREFHDSAKAIVKGKNGQHAEDVAANGTAEEIVYKSEGITYKCDVDGCPEIFAKRKHLRSHIALRHSDAGQSMDSVNQEEAERIVRLPFPCTRPGCSKRFATNYKRNVHSRTHEDASRYMCALPHTTGGAGTLYFPTWSELQAHQRKCHPPTCTWPNCGKVFANAQNLRLHLHRHEAREKGATPEGDDDGEDVSDDEEMEDHSSPGLSFPCDFVAQDGSSLSCTKVFRSKYARLTHVKNQHLGLREFLCTQWGCSRKYGNKRSLNRHLLKQHGGQEEASTYSQTPSDAEGPDDDFFRQEGGAVPEPFAERKSTRKRRRADDEANEDPFRTLLPTLTGQGYSTPADSRKRRLRGRVVSCPWPAICQLRDGGAVDGEGCAHRFSRLYDVQRHLQAKHGVDLTQGDIFALVSQEESSQLATPRRSASKERTE